MPPNPRRQVLYSSQNLELFPRLHRRCDTVMADHHGTSMSKPFARDIAAFDDEELGRYLKEHGRYSAILVVERLFILSC